MASLKDLRSRIASVKSTRKITSAMKMVAASKLRRAQDAAEAARPYADRMARMIGSIVSGASTDGAPPLLGGTGKDKIHLLIPVTSDRGLCGGFKLGAFTFGCGLNKFTAPTHDIKEIGIESLTSLRSIRLRILSYLLVISTVRGRSTFRVTHGARTTRRPDLVL